MSIAAEHVAGRQRRRERLRAITLERKLAVRGLVAIAVLSVATARSCLKPMAKKAAQQLTPRLTVR